jgi:hypothetical protein
MYGCYIVFYALLYDKMYRVKFILLPLNLA